MKKSIIFKYIILLAIVFTSFSCTKEEIENFDKSATERLQERIDEVKKTLFGSEQGWVMKYYTGASQSGGGFIYTVKFTESEAEVGFEYAVDLSKTLTSLYKITDDNGPVLSFDTYNDYLHYFSTPNSSLYQGLGGDFEFEVFEVTPSKITMVGRRSRNIITLEPLNVSSLEYLQGVEKMSKNFVPYFINGKVGNETVSGTVNYSERNINITIGGQEMQTAFCFTPTGLSLYKPISAGDVVVTDIDYNMETMKLTANSVELSGSVPQGWLPYDQYEGKYRLDYAGSWYANVTLTPGTYNSTYIMSGLNKNYDIILNYNMQTGRLEMNSQMIGTVDGYSIYFCAWALDGGGSVTWSSYAGLQTAWNGDEQNPVYTFEPNGFSWRNGSGQKCVTDSFILFAVSSSDVFYFDRSAWGTNGYAQWPYVKSLTKL